MPLRVAENRILYRIPLNAPEDLDRLVFFHGLDAFGVIGPNLGSQRPVLTRQAYYPYPKLPKALYLFAPADRLDQYSPAERHEYIFSHADAYLFRWNQDHPESRLNARGTSPDFEPDRHGQYIHCDAGHSWVHDPLHYDPDEQPSGPHQATAEETISGRSLLDNRFDDYERAVGALLRSWVIACDRFDLLPDKCRNRSSTDRRTTLEERYSRLVPKGADPSENSLRATADWLLSLVPEDHPLLEHAHFSDEVFSYEPVTGESRLLSYSEVRALEQALLGLGHAGDRDEIETILNQPQHLKHLVHPVSLDTAVPHEVVHQDNLYSATAMAYFLAGLNGDRPHAQVMGYFQVLEHVMHVEIRKRKLQPLLQAMPSSDLERCYAIALGGEEDALSVRGPKGKLDRAALAGLLIKEMRNPAVHAGSARPGQAPPVRPYAAYQFEPRFRQLVRIAREIARYWVSRSG